MPANSVPPSRRSVATHDPSIAPSSNSSSTQYLNPPVVTISSNQTSPVKRIFTVTRTKSGDVGQQTNLSTQLLPSSAHPNTNTTWGMVHTPGRNRTPQRSPTRTGTAAYLDAHNTYISNLRTSMAHDTFSHPRSYAAQQPTHLSSLSHGDTSHTIENRLVRSNLQDELNADHSVPSSLPLLPISATTQHSVAESHRALIRAERDLESVREELNRTRSELDDARKNLERERDDKTRSMTSLQSQAEKTQEEMGRRHRELLDQIAVLKSLNDAATEERTRILEEHEQRKQHYTSLLEHERNEKTRLLDEYRGQTEALLSDQGKEIESLRSLLDTETSKEKTMAQELHDAQQRKTDLELALRRAETALADERSIRQKSTNSVENDANNKVHMINETHERNAREWKATLERVTAAKEQLQEQLVAAMNQTEALRNQLSAEREESRRKHEKEIDAVLRELRDAKAWRERSEEQSRAEVDKVTRESEELVVSLRRELEILRSDKQALYEQNRHTKETMMNEHQARLQHLHTSIDNLRKELSEERQSRKDAESMRQTLNVKLDQAHVEIARLHSENERTQLDSRQTERQLSTDHLNLVENLKGQIRTLEGEHLHARSQVKKLEDEVRHWVNQAENLREELVSEQLGARTQAEEARRNYYHIAEQLEENRSSSAKAIEAAQARRIEVEAELARCQSLNEELHAKLSLSSKNLVAERRRVENLTDELCKANAMLDREKGAHQKTLNIVMEKESELEDLIRAKEDALRDRAVARREQDVLREQHERDLERQTEAHNSKMLDCELKSEGFKQEIIALEEQIRAREGTIHDLAKTIESHRNTISKLQVTLNSQNATSRRQYELTENHFSEEIARMEAILQTLKEDLNKSNQARYALQREHAERLREHERQVLALQESCEAERAARVRITEEVRSAEHNQTEQQAMIRMLTTRIQSREEELRKAETELQNTQTKYQECTMHVGRKESQIHQLMARIRALELRVPATPGKLLH